MPTEPLSGNQIKASITGNLVTEPGGWVSVVGGDNAVKMKGFSLKSSLANGSRVSEGDIIGDNPSGFVRYGYNKDKSGNLIPVTNFNDFLKGKKSEDKTGSDKKTSSTIPQYSKLSEVPGVQGMVGVSMPQVGLASTIINKEEKQIVNNDIIAEEVDKIKKLMKL
jgi:hypothetical protein